MMPLTTDEIQTLCDFLHVCTFSESLSHKQMEFEDIRGKLLQHLDGLATEF